MSISEIFVRYGEQKFREAETAALRQMRTEEPKIIVTGGGIVLHKENIGILKKQAVIVWLDGNEEALFARAFRQQNRPLLRTKNPRVAFSQILTSRRPLYAKLANVRVDTSELTDEEIAVAILAKLEKMHCNPESPLPPKPS